MICAWDVKKAKTGIKRWGSFEVNSDSEDDMPRGEAYTFLPVVSKIFLRRGVLVSRVVCATKNPHVYAKIRL